MTIFENIFKKWYVLHIPRANEEIKYQIGGKYLVRPSDDRKTLELHFYGYKNKFKDYVKKGKELSILDKSPLFTFRCNKCHKLFVFPEVQVILKDKKVLYNCNACANR